MYAYRQLGLAPATVGPRASSPLILFRLSFIFAIRAIHHLLSRSLCLLPSNYRLDLC